MWKTNTQGRRLKSFMQKLVNVGAKANLVTQLSHMILVFLEGREKALRADSEKV